MPTSSRAWITRVGTLIVGRIDRTSIRNIASSVARAIPGLALMRSNVPNWRVDRTDGISDLSAAPLPHSERTTRPYAWMRAICSTVGVYCSPSSGRIRARSSAESADTSSQPNGPTYANVLARINARVRCGRLAANTIAAGPPSLNARIAALENPAASMTASISAARSSRLRTCGTGSDSPTPALSNSTMRQKVDGCSKKDLNSGWVQNNSTWLANGPATTSSTGPSPNTWYARLRPPHGAYAVSPTH